MPEAHLKIADAPEDILDEILPPPGEDEPVDKDAAHSFGRKLNLVLCAVAFFVLFGYLFVAGEGEDTLHAIANFNWWFLLLTFVGIVIYWLLEAVAMQIICDKLFTGFHFAKTVIVTIIGQYFNCITPLSSGGQPMQAYYYGRFGLPVRLAMPMLLCRFIVYQFTMTLYAVIVLILRFNYFTQDLRAIMYLVAIGFIGGLGLMAMLLALAFAKGPVTKLTVWFLTVLGNFNVLKDPQEKIESATASLEEAYRGMKFLLKEPAMLVKSSLVTFVQLTVFFSLSFIIYCGFGLTATDYFTVLSCQAFIYLIMSFVPLPGAIGVSEGSYVMFFNYVYGSAFVVALSTFVWRAFTFYLPIVLGMILTLLVNNPKSKLAAWIAKDDARLEALKAEQAAAQAEAERQAAAEEEAGEQAVSHAASDDEAAAGQEAASEAETLEAETAQEDGAEATAESVQEADMMIEETTQEAASEVASELETDAAEGAESACASDSEAGTDASGLRTRTEEDSEIVPESPSKSE